MYRVSVSGKTRTEVIKNFGALFNLDAEEAEAPVKAQPVATATAVVEYDLSKDVRPAMHKYAKANGREAALKLLKTFGVETTDKLPKDRYEELMAKLAE